MRMVASINPVNREKGVDCGGAREGVREEVREGVEGSRVLRAMVEIRGAAAREEEDDTGAHVCTYCSAVSPLVVVYVWR